jgi:hypothetical protein
MGEDLSIYEVVEEWSYFVRLVVYEELTDIEDFTEFKVWFFVVDYILLVLVQEREMEFKESISYVVEIEVILELIL